MRILITGMANYVSFNGQTVFTINLAEGLARLGHAVQLLLPSDQGKGYTVVRNGVQLQTIDSINLRFLHPEVFFPPFPVGMIRHVLDTFRPEIIHIHDHYPMSVIARRLARRRKLKVVGTNHFMPENLAPHMSLLTKNHALYDWIMWQWMLSLFNRLDAVTTPSRTAAEIILKQGLHVPVVPISNGVDLARFFPQPKIDVQAWRQRFGLHGDKKIFLFVGRVDGEKRLDVLIKAMAQLERDDIQLAITGRGTAFNELMSLTANLGLYHKVRFTGFVPAEDLPAILNSADIFVMPSEAELLSIATLEAMACGKPVLAAAARALPELVCDGCNGYLFKPGDVDDAARLMGQMADQPEQWPKMGAASLERIQLHSLENTIRSYESVYQRVLAEATLPMFQTTSNRITV